MISSLGCSVSRRSWGPLWGWSQWGLAWCFIFYRWGRCVPRQYTAQHLCCRRWWNSQTQSHDLACRSDTDFAAWKEQQISKGMKGIEEQDNMVNNYTDGKRKPKNPDPLGPPISYMEERGVFQPLASTTNPLGLCRIYRVDSNVSAPKTPKPPATVEHVKKLLLLASTQWQSYVIVVFQGGTVTPLGLLQELHTQSTLVCIPICLPGETKDGHRPHVSCCPFCAYTIQNNLAYLNHIICAHYDASFGCGACLSAVTSSGQQMNHIKECSGLAPPPTASQESTPGGHSPKKGAPGSKHVQGKKKGHHSEKSQPAGQGSQDSQASDRCITRATGASQESTTGSTQHRTRHKKKKAKTHKEKKSSK